MPVLVMRARPFLVGWIPHVDWPAEIIGADPPEGKEQRRHDTRYDGAVVYRQPDFLE